jgi:hypothetical protein
MASAGEATSTSKDYETYHILAAKSEGDARVILDAFVARDMELLCVLLYEHVLSVKEALELSRDNLHGRTTRPLSIQEITEKVHSLRSRKFTLLRRHIFKQFGLYQSHGHRYLCRKLSPHQHSQQCCVNSRQRTQQPRIEHHQPT